MIILKISIHAEYLLSHGFTDWVAKNFLKPKKFIATMHCPLLFRAILHQALIPRRLGNRRSDV